MNLLLQNMNALVLVFMRMTGMIAFNPVLSRRNMPSRARVMLIACLTLLLTPVVDAAPARDYGGLDLAVGMIRELFIGFVCAYIFLLFYYLLFFIGDLMDMQFGLSMAKVFDPGTSIQMSVSGNLLSLLFMLYFFATDSHLLMIKVFATSYDILPLGAAGISFTGGASFVLELFVSAFSLAMRLSLPFIAVEFIVEVSMGVLMKLIPQIHVFVINIQFKLLFALFMLLAFAHPISEFVDKYLSTVFTSMEKALYLLAG